MTKDNNTIPAAEEDLDLPRIKGIMIIPAGTAGIAGIAGATPRTRKEGPPNLSNPTPRDKLRKLSKE